MLNIVGHYFIVTLIACVYNMERLCVCVWVEYIEDQFSAAAVARQTKHADLLILLLLRPRNPGYSGEKNQCHEIWFKRIEPYFLSKYKFFLPNALFKLQTNL